MEVFIDCQTRLRLEKIAEETMRDIDDLAVAAVAEAALSYFRGRNDDPARPSRSNGAAQ